MHLALHREATSLGLFIFWEYSLIVLALTLTSFEAGVGFTDDKYLPSTFDYLTVWMTVFRAFQRG